MIYASIRSVHRSFWGVGVALILSLCISPVAEAQVVYANGVQVLTPGEQRQLSDLLSQAQQARVVHLTGDAGEHMDLFLQAQHQLIRQLHEKAGYAVLVLPVGIFEGVWTDRALENGAAPFEAAHSLYRVWRESETFRSILAYIQETQLRAEGLEMIGGLSRFHAAGKEIYANHLIEFFDTAQDDLFNKERRLAIRRLWGGRGRLSRTSKAHRSEAHQLAEDLLKHFDTVQDRFVAYYGERRTALARHILVNMGTFVELEQIRGGDLEDDGSFGAYEKGQNLTWFLEHRYPDERLIYWEGRGDSIESLPTDEPVFMIELSMEPGN
jgi:erythromycin esterase-like protein